jgi:hypothetical protein
MLVIVAGGRDHGAVLAAALAQARFELAVITPPPPVTIRREELRPDMLRLLAERDLGSRLTVSEGYGETAAARGQRIAQERRRALQGPKRGRY